MNLPLDKLRASILSDRRVKRPSYQHDDLSTTITYPDIFPKTAKMKYLELKYNMAVELTIFNGSLDDIVRLVNYEIDRSTISRWRRHVLRYVMFNQVRGEGEK